MESHKESKGFGRGNATKKKYGRRKPHPDRGGSNEIAIKTPRARNVRCRSGLFMMGTLPTNQHQLLLSKSEAARAAVREGEEGTKAQKFCCLNSNDRAKEKKKEKKLKPT